jgi:hypothetical protein
MTAMLAEGTDDSSLGFSVWFGKPVILLVIIRQCRVPVPCSIVGESVTDVRVRIGPGWEMNLRKELILAVEEDAVGVDRPTTIYRIN